MLDVLLTLVRSLLTALRDNRDLALENLALRHQLMVTHRELKRPRLGNADRALWVLLRRLWPKWDKAVVFVKVQPWDSRKDKIGCRGRMM